MNNGVVAVVAVSRSRSRRDGFVQSGLSLTRSTMQSLDEGKCREGILKRESSSESR